MKSIICLTVTMLCCSALAFAAADHLQALCDQDNSAACYDLGNTYYPDKSALALYYWRKALAVAKKNKNEKNMNKYTDKIIKVFDHDALNLPREEQMCLVVQLLPWSLRSSVISVKTNTIDKNIEAEIGNLKSILVNSNIGLGVQVDYSFQTFVNAIRQLYNNGNIGHAITWMYLLGEAYAPDNPQEGMVAMLKNAAGWTFSKGLLDDRNAMAQYGTALQAIDLIKNNKIKNPLLKKIISALITGSVEKVGELLYSDQKIMMQAVDTYKKIRIDSCQLPAQLLD